MARDWGQAWSTAWGVSWVSTPTTVIHVGGDDAPRKRKRRKERHELFQEIEATIHGLLHPESVESEERALPALAADGTAAGRAARAVDELLILAQGQHDLLQRAAAIRAELDLAIEARNRMLDQDEEDALLWMF